MASGTGGWNAGAYGDDGWNDGIVLSETGIAATLALGSETASGSALINQVGYDNLRISLADLSANITGTKAYQYDWLVQLKTAIEGENGLSGISIFRFLTLSSSFNFL